MIMIIIMIMILTMMTLGREASRPWHVFLGFALSPGRMVSTIMMTMVMTMAMGMEIGMAKSKKSPNHCRCSACYGTSWCHIQPYSNQLCHLLQISCRVPISFESCFFCCIFVHCMSFLICSPNSCAISLPMPPESWIPREFIAQLRKSPSTWFCKMIKSFPSACRFVNLFQPVVSYKYNFKIHDHRAICLALGVCKSIKSFSTSWVEWNEVL